MPDNIMIKGDKGSILIQLNATEILTESCFIAGFKPVD